MRVDDTLDLAVASMLAVQSKSGLCGFRCAERVHYNNTSITLNNRHVRDVVASDLIDSVGNLEQAMYTRQLALSPQFWVDGSWASILEEGILLAIPDDSAVASSND